MNEYWLAYFFRDVLKRGVVSGYDMPTVDINANSGDEDSEDSEDDSDDADNSSDLITDIFAETEQKMEPLEWHDLGDEDDDKEDSSDYEYDAPTKPANVSF